MSISTDSILVPFSVEIHIEILPKFSPEDNWKQVAEAFERVYKKDVVYCDVYVKANNPGEIDFDEETLEVSTDEEFERVINTYPRVDILIGDSRRRPRIYLISDKREHLEMFCKDFNISQEIEENVIVSQTM